MEPLLPSGFSEEGAELYNVLVEEGGVWWRGYCLVLAVFSMCHPITSERLIKPKISTDFTTPN